MEKIFKVYQSFEESKKDEIAIYRSMSPQERLEVLESLREKIYDKISSGFPRVFEIVRKE